MAHSSVEKDIMISGVKMRKLKVIKTSDGNYSINSIAFEAAIKVCVFKLLKQIIIN